MFTFYSHREIKFFFYIQHPVCLSECSRESVSIASFKNDSLREKFYIPHVNKQVYLGHRYLSILHTRLIGFSMVFLRVLQFSSLRKINLSLIYRIS